MGYYDYSGREAAAGWCEAIAEIPYCHYKMYADKKIIRDNLPALKKLLDYYETESPDFIRSGEGTYGNWLSLGNPTDLSVVYTLYYARAAQLASKMCGIIGDYEEEYYNNLYSNIKNAFRKNFIDANGKIKSDTQSAYVIAYSFVVL